MACGSIVILSGPSGAGKSSLIHKLFDDIDHYFFSISTTTRAPRKGEIEGVNYFYISQEAFKQDIEDGYFLEWAQVHGNYYGTSLKPVQKALDEGKLVLFDIDVQGNEDVRRLFPHISTSIFVTTPNLSELEHRLSALGTDSAEIIENRLKGARQEVARIDEYDYLIINDSLEDAYKSFYNIISGLKNRTFCLNKEKFIKDWVE